METGERADSFPATMRDPLAELDAMKAIAAELKKLDESAVARVLRWAAEAFGAKAAPPVRVPATTMNSQERGSAGDLKTRYPTLPDFYTACGPSQETDKALVVGYWTQVIQGIGDFDAQSINKELKQLGYGIANITSAFDSLQARKPQLVIQTKKSGTSRQARKLYKLTVEGMRAVERMLGGIEE